MPKLWGRSLFDAGEVSVEVVEVVVDMDETEISKRPLVSETGDEHHTVLTGRHCVLGSQGVCNGSVHRNGKSILASCKVCSFSG